MKIRSVVITGISFCLLFASNNCGKKESPQEKGPVWESVSFPIMTWFGIRAEHFDIEHFQDLADAGFTINFSHVFDVETNKKALDLAAQVGVKLLIGDARINPNSPVDEAALTLIDQVVADYKDHPALFGYHVRDEPSAEIFNNMAAIRNRIIAQDPYHLVYGNLYPAGVDPERLGTPTYEEHVDKFMQIFQPRILSYDHYPFTNLGFRPHYYENMATIRAAASKYNVPFWAFTMSCAINPRYPEPKESWIRMQAYTDLAYGARGIQYFTYGLPESSTERFTIAILDENGDKTHIYDFAKRINAEIHNLAPTLKQLKTVDVYHAEPLPKGTQGLPEDFFIRELDGIPVLVGYFHDPKNKNYIMLVSRDSETKGAVKLTVSDEVGALIEISRENGSDMPAVTPEHNTIMLDFAHGDGRLFRVEK